MNTQTLNKINILLALLALGVIGYLGFQNYTLNQTRIALEIELENTKQDFVSTTEKLSGDIEAFRNLLITTQGEKVTAEQETRRQHNT